MLTRHSLSILPLSFSSRFPRSMRTATEAVLSSLVLCHLLSQPASLIATGRFRAFCAHRWRRYAPTTVSFHLEFRSPRVLQGFVSFRFCVRSAWKEWGGAEPLMSLDRPFQLVVTATSAVFETEWTLHSSSIVSVISGLCLGFFLKRILDTKNTHFLLFYRL